MFTTVKYVFYTALRDWLFVGIIIALGFAAFISNFLGSTSMVEQDLMLSSFLSSSSRIIIIIGLIIFICFHVRKAFENKEIDLMLSRPISRTQFIISYWMGFCLVFFIIISLLTICMSLFITYNTEGLLLWAGTLLLETMIVSALAVFASVVLKSSVSAVLLCFGFYFVSRIMGFFTYIVEKENVGDFTSFSFISQKIITLASSIMPRLDMFAQSKWVVYGVEGISSGMLYPALQSLIYIPLLLVLAAIDFTRKQF